MYNRTVTSILLAVALLLGLGPSASATDYGKPYGRWFEAIVTHEVGHCLGWYEHKTPSPSIMRTSLGPYSIANGSQPYTPSSNDRARMQASRANSVAGEDNTTYVQYPFVSDYVPVYNRTGRSSAFTAADRWDPYTSLNVVSVGYNPDQGIDIKWDSSRAGTSVGGWITHTWVWNGSFWQIGDCTVHINTDVET
jgi:hypothetical protein